MGKSTQPSTASGIRRGPRLADHFTILSNAIVNDERLSFRARGILAYLLAKPADWVTRSEAIAAQSPKEGREAIRTAMRELEELGYLVRERVQNERGHWATIQTVYEEPSLSRDVEPAPTENTRPAPKPKKPVSGTADVGKLGVFTKDGSQRNETNDNTTRVGASPAALDSSMSSSFLDQLDEKTRDHVLKSKRDFAELEAAALAAGLPASFAKCKPGQKGQILAMIAVHGVERLVDAAVRAHNPSNPTMHVHGWVRLWLALPLPRPTPNEQAMPEARAKCSDCEGTGFVLNDDDLAVRCACRTSRNGSAVA